MRYPKSIMTVSELHELGYPKRFLYEIAKKDGAPVIKEGKRRILFKTEALDAFIKLDQMDKLDVIKPLEELKRTFPEVFKKRDTVTDLKMLLYSLKSGSEVHHNDDLVFVTKDDDSIGYEAKCTGYYNASIGSEHSIQVICNVYLSDYTNKEWKKESIEIIGWK